MADYTLFYANIMQNRTYQIPAIKKIKFFGCNSIFFGLTAKKLFLVETPRQRLATYSVRKKNIKKPKS